MLIAGDLIKVGEIMSTFPASELLNTIIIKIVLTDTANDHVGAEVACVIQTGFYSRDTVWYVWCVVSAYFASQQCVRVMHVTLFSFGIGIV